MRSYYLIALVLLSCAVVAPAARARTPAAIAKVVTMLENLITMMESEGSEDEKKFNHFNQYCESEKTASTNKISELNTKIEDTNAALQDLMAQKAELDSVVGKLTGEIDQEQSQVDAATEKRNSEHDAFAKEQQDFANAVAACEKAVKLLGDHYGDAPREAKKPSWMSLVDTQITTISKSVDSLSAKGQHKKLAVLKSNKAVLALLHMHKGKGKGPFEQYSDSRDESMNIVDQIKVLAETFAEDKQSAIEEENRLQKTFEGLISKKNAILSTLRGERDTQQAVLNQVNQNIAENQSALKMAQDTLKDTQTYLAAVTKQHQEATEMYETRVKDRKAETEAVNKALDVLSEFSFIQKGVKALDKAKDMGKHPHRRGNGNCAGCAKVAAMLRQKAKLYHSAVLSAAAATSMGSDAIDGVIDNLKELMQRIDEEQKTEKEHKDWCEEETGLTNAKVADHSGIVDEMKTLIADLGEVIKEKEIDLDNKEEDIYDEDNSFEAMTEIRKEEKEEFEEDLQDHMDAIQALNEAIEILANFYAKRKAKGASAMVQIHHKKLSFLQRSMEPAGGKVVEMMSETRHEFEEAKVHLEKEEVEAVKTFDDTRKRHMKVDSDLNADKNQITVEEQTAEAQLDTAKHDKATNEDEVEAANNYLKQLGRSCYPLMMHFDERTRLRKEEKDAIKDAIKVLRDA